MRLCILRHGIAEEPHPGLADRDRRLTPAGIARMERAARGMHLLGLRFDEIRTSPLPRASETADLVAAALGGPAPIRDDRLACGAVLPDYREMLARAGARSSVLLVGHEPDCSGLVEALTGGLVRMKKASLACVDVEAVVPGGGVLRWLLECAHLEQMAGG